MTNFRSDPRDPHPPLRDAPRPLQARIALIATAGGAFQARDVREDQEGQDKGEAHQTTPLSPGEARRLARDGRALFCHGPDLSRRLGLKSVAGFDLLQLFAFVRPARFCLPTPRGVARALGLSPGRGHGAEALSLFSSARILLEELARTAEEAQPPARDRLIALARVMDAGGWLWGRDVLAALGTVPGMAIDATSALAAWRDLPEWSEEAPPSRPGQLAVGAQEARDRLALLIDGGEQRPQQADYAAMVAEAFAPRQEDGQPRLVLAEAGTGTGKTLGYIAPASLWAERNGGAVWVSTFTRNLQRQIDQELNRLYPDPAIKARKVVVRKGRENYLCLLNFEEASQRAALDPQEAAALGLMARWVAASRDGDMIGGDFPAWLGSLLGNGRTLGLAERRGECIYAACAHYHRCFIERAVRRARHADLVIANHALVMSQAAMAGLDDATVPSRYIFDEGHHLFSAADSAFAAHLSGRETAELRHWILGPEDRRHSRARGLARRLGELAAFDDEAAEALQETLSAASCLPATGWLARIQGASGPSGHGAAQVQGPAERFLRAIRQQVLARANPHESAYSLEAEVLPPGEGVLESAAELETALAALARPLERLHQRLARVLSTRSEDLDASIRLRIEGGLRMLERRAAMPVDAWRAMLASLAEGAPEDFCDWFGLSRAGGQETDIGFHRHWIDPTRPLARHVLSEAHGAAITSATLTDSSGDPLADWAGAEAQTGARHLSGPVLRASHASPFDYGEAARLFIVNDIDRTSLDAVADAYRALFLAAGGGGLGLFTSIARLKAVHQRIAPPLDAAGLTLHAQHVDAIDTPTLIDIFREETESCLLGTDAVRDGVDVPGDSLRLIVFDRVPWPRPDLLHKARRKAFGPAFGGVRGYDDMLTRLRLKQAFGRLIRRDGDRGVFVLLDRFTPSRLLAAFPEATPIRRLGLKDVVAATSAFLRKQEPG